MAVQDILNIDTTDFVIGENVRALRKDDVTFEQDAGRATVLAQYTLMANKPVTIPTTGTADAGNTGDGTVTAVAAAAGGVPAVGDYTLECTFAVANGGVFKLTDPGANIVADNLTLRVGAGLLTTFVEAGITFTVTDGATDFAAGDKFTITTTANGKTVPFDATAVDGTEIPEGIYMGADIPAADLVAGDVLDNPVVYSAMKFDEAKLVFDNGSDTLATILPTGRTIRAELELMGLIASPVDVTTNYENA
jgi:hypothetical protein